MLATLDDEKRYQEYMRREDEEAVLFILLTNFKNDIKEGIVPKKFPDRALDSLGLFNDDLYLSRDLCTKRGMWAIVDMTWTKKLADYIAGRRCLEVMAGAGWLARALSDHGVDIVATDNASWSDKHTEMRRIFPVKKMEALEAIDKYGDRDILIVSWPPLNMDILYFLKRWGEEKPIIYIGEGNGGCNTTDEFWNHFSEETTIYIPQWWGIHDQVFIGKYHDTIN